MKVNGITDLLASERGVFCIALLLVSAVFVFIGKLDAQAWIDLMKYLAVTLVASKTVTRAVETYTNKIPVARDVSKEG